MLGNRDIDEVLVEAREHLKQRRDAVAKSEAEVKTLDIEGRQHRSNNSWVSKTPEDCKNHEGVAAEKLKLASLAKAEADAETQKAAPMATSTQHPQETHLIVAEEQGG
jgi:hypothetical protein